MQPPVPVKPAPVAQPAAAPAVNHGNPEAMRMAHGEGSHKSDAQSEGTPKALIDRNIRLHMQRAGRLQRMVLAAADAGNPGAVALAHAMCNSTEFSLFSNPEAFLAQEGVINTMKLIGALEILLLAMINLFSNFLIDSAKIKLGLSNRTYMEAFEEHWGTYTERAQKNLRIWMTDPQHRRDQAEEKVKDRGAEPAIEHEEPAPEVKSAPRFTPYLKSTTEDRKLDVQSRDDLDVKKGDTQLDLFLRNVFKDPAQTKPFVGEHKREELDLDNDFVKNAAKESAAKLKKLGA